MNGPASEKIGAALDAADAALDAIGQIAGAQEKLEAAGKLRDGLRARSDGAARIQHAEALRIHREEGLSLAQLASRVGISKARADQIINPDRPRKKRETRNA